MAHTRGAHQRTNTREPERTSLLQPRRARIGVCARSPHNTLRGFLPTHRSATDTDGGNPHGSRHTVRFRQPTTAAARIRDPDEQLLYGQGYDHYFILPRAHGDAIRLAARAFDPSSGRVLEIHTTQPGLQFYTGNQLNGSVAGRGGIYRQSAGFAFEPQGYPDAAHHPQFPSTVLRPQQLYRECIGYRFGTVSAETSGGRAAASRGS